MTPFNVQKLRANGYKVRVIHSRRKASIGNQGVPLLDPMLPQKDIPGVQRCTKGGATTVELRTPEGKEVSVTAMCHENDTFNRKRGLQIALGRAIAELDGTAEARRAKKQAKKLHAIKA